MYMLLMILILVLAFLIYFRYRSLFEYKHPDNVYKIVKGTFTRLIKKHKLSIAEINLFGNRLIAVDNKTNKLILINYKHGIVWEKCLNLQDMVVCRIAKNINKVSGDMQKVNLELTFRKGGIISFPFFDEKIDVLSDLPARIKRAQYWKGKIRRKKQASSAHLHTTAA